MMEKKVKLTDEVVANLWNEKRIIRDKKITKIPRIIFPMHKLKTTKDIIKDIEEGEFKEDLIFFHRFLTILAEEYEDETGRHATWRGKITKQFIRWLEEYDKN